MANNIGTAIAPDSFAAKSSLLNSYFNETDSM